MLQLLLNMLKKTSIAYHFQFSSVQSLSHVWLFVTPWIPVGQASQSISNSWSLLKLMSIKSVMPSSHLILCHPLLLPPIPPSRGSCPMSQLFAWGGWSIVVSASVSVLPMNIWDWFPLGWTGWIPLQSKGLLRVFSTPQFKSMNFLVLSFLYSPTLTSLHAYWKNHSFEYTTFVGKVVSLPFKMLSRWIITFRPRTNCLWTSWLQSSSAVILEPPEIKSVTVSSLPIYFPWSVGTRGYDLSFLNVEF